LNALGRTFVRGGESRTGEGADRTPPTWLERPGTLGTLGAIGSGRATGGIGRSGGIVDAAPTTARSLRTSRRSGRATGSAAGRAGRAGALDPAPKGDRDPEGTEFPNCGRLRAATCVGRGAGRSAMSRALAAVLGTRTPSGRWVPMPL
jgi:hypothetical protein